MAIHTTSTSDELDQLGGTAEFRIWATRGIFFTYADRLTSNAKSSVNAITFLSFYVVVASLVPLVFQDQFKPLTIKVIGAATLVISIFIIVINLMENSRNLALVGDRAISAAKDLEKLYGKAQAKILSGQALMEEYDRVLLEANCRFERIDYHYFQLDNPVAFKLDRRKRFIILVLYLFEWARDQWPYLILTLAPLGAAMVVLYIFK